MKIHPKYKPIGTEWRRLFELNGIALYGTRRDFHCYEEDVTKLVELIPEAEKEYETNVRLHSEIVSHGNTNRDGHYTERMITWSYLVGEFPKYSPEDSKEIFKEEREEFLEKYRKLVS